ncbi:hypothetical protein ACH4U5_15750 [Streptomyces sp. NPDC020858]|uniref:hypothetical protein n=1 Tax=Streptomyces sp. NPDC020858 TaxID=3365097 RepID=UPI00378F79B3
MGRSYREATIKLLFGTATHCAYPGCAKPLIFKDRGLYTPTAQIAHIRSEKLNGPRYEANFSQVNEFENLLLLCGEHHPPVDRHESNYSIGELLEWKREQSLQGERSIGTAELSAIGRSINGESPVTADAVLRGPIASLEQGERLQQAEDRLSETPLESATLFEQVAIRLESSPFVHHATIVRARQCGALEKGGKFIEAARVRIEIGWSSYAAGDVSAAVAQVRCIDGYKDPLPADLERAKTGLAYAAAFGFERRVSIDDLAEAFDQMETADQGIMNVAVALAEESITWRRADVISARSHSLSELADAIGSDDHGVRQKARIRMCLAEAADDWSGLVNGARSVYPPEIVAWIAARHARYLSLTGKPDEAESRWRDAVDGAVTSGLNDSAADWLYALRATRVMYWRVNSGVDDPHRIAQSLRAAGKGAVLPEPYPLAERALSRMLDQKWPDALQCLHQSLRHSVVSASWAAELTTHERFGDLFRSTQKWSEAPLHYIRSARSKKLKELSKEWPNQALELHPPSSDAPHWERKSACEFIFHSGKHLTSEIASLWAEYACREICENPPTMAHTATWFSAFNAFAATADEASLEASGSFLELAASIFDREVGSHHRADEAVIMAIVKISDSHPLLGPRTLAILCEAIRLRSEVSQRAVYSGQEILARYPAEVRSFLDDDVEGGNLYAAMALVVAGSDVSSCAEIARDNLQEYLRPLEVHPGITTLRVGLEDAAYVIGVLGDVEKIRFIDAMFARARETRDLESNRADAVAAIGIVGASLSPERRDPVFDALLEFSKDPAPSVVSMEWGEDPFSRFTVRDRVFSLGVGAVEAASKLAHTAEQYSELQRLIVPMLPVLDNSTCSSIARILRNIPRRECGIDLAMLAAHSNSWIRCFAALAWGDNPQAWPGLGDRLAGDVDAGVRLILARGADDSPEYDSVRNVLRADYRRDVRRGVK